MTVSVNTNRGPVAGKKLFGVGDRLQVVRCNHCKQVVLHEHQALHAFECRKKRNAAKLGAMNLSKDGKPLYAVAVSIRRNGRWQAPEIRYTHANSASEAKRFAMADEQALNYHIINAGLAVGWFQDEKTGIIVSG